ncbi:hypothetical protein JXJ21_22215 [candidate division KSB1 bacterium]|nr:hypothetical protein [candidate division KSB1 bacterium]
MKKIALTIIISILCLNVAPALSQSDDQKRKPSPKSRLELPDVLVVGTDTQIRVTGLKLSVPGDHARLLPMESSYKSYDLNSMINEQKGDVRTEISNRDDIHKYLLGYGSYNDVKAQFLRWQKLFALQYSVGAKFHQSDGQYANSQFKSGELNGKLSYNRRQRIRAETIAGYAFRDYGLQGSIFENHERKTRSVGMALRSQFRGSQATFGSVDIHYNMFDLSNDSKLKLTPGEVEERTLAFSGQTFWTGSHLRISLKGSFLMNTINVLKESDQVDYISALILKGNYKYSSNFSIMGGLHLNNISIENSDPQTELMPFGKLIFSLKNRWGFYISGSQEYIYQTYLNVWRENNFISESFNRLAHNIEYKIDIGTELKLREDWLAKLNWKVQQIKNYPFFEPTFNSDSLKADGLYRYQYLNQVKQNTISFSVDFKVAPRFDIKGSLNYNAFNISDDSLLFSDNRIPYIEDLNAELDFAYTIFKNTKVKISATYFGDRKKHIERSEYLDQYVLLNAGIEKQYYQYITLFAKLHNLLNYNYQIWDGYKEPGINFSCGIKGQW